MDGLTPGMRIVAVLIIIAAMVGMALLLSSSEFQHLVGVNRPPFPEPTPIIFR